MQGDQLVAKEYYLAKLAMDEHMQTMSIDERRVTTEPTEALEDVPLEKVTSRSSQGLEQAWK